MSSRTKRSQSQKVIKEHEDFRKSKSQWTQVVVISFLPYHSGECVCVMWHGGDTNIATCMGHINKRSLLQLCCETGGFIIFFLKNCSRNIKKLLKFSSK